METFSRQECIVRTRERVAAAALSGLLVVATVACTDEDGDGAGADEEIDQIDEGIEDLDNEIEEIGDEIQEEVDQLND
jgi:hypothetical protein